MAKTSGPAQSLSPDAASELQIGVSARAGNQSKVAKAPAPRKGKARAQPDPKPVRKAQPKRKSAAKAQPSKALPPQSPPTKKRLDRRGTPKGKGVADGKQLGPGKKPGRIGNPPFVATDEQRAIVESHAAVGTPHWLIADELGISEDTLTRHFAPELERGLARVNARIGSQVARDALGGSAKHQFFWLKCRGGWKERAILEHSGLDGAPIGHSLKPQLDLSKLSVKELRELERLTAKVVPDVNPGA